MKDWQSQSHVKWDCKYHVVIVPKYRQRVFFGTRRKQIGEILQTAPFRGLPHTTSSTGGSDSTPDSSTKFRSAWLDQSGGMMPGLPFWDSFTVACGMSGILTAVVDERPEAFRFVVASTTLVVSPKRCGDFLSGQTLNLDQVLHDQFQQTAKSDSMCFAFFRKQPDNQLTKSSKR